MVIVASSCETSGLLFVETENRIIQNIKTTEEEPKWVAVFRQSSERQYAHIWHALCSLDWLQAEPRSCLRGLNEISKFSYLSSCISLSGRIPDKLSSWMQRARFVECIRRQFGQFCYTAPKHGRCEDFRRFSANVFRVLWDNGTKASRRILGRRTQSFERA